MGDILLPPPPQPIPPHMRDPNRPRPTSSINTVDYGGSDMPPVWWWVASVFITIDVCLVIATIRTFTYGAPF